MNPLGKIMLGVFHDEILVSGSGKVENNGIIIPRCLYGKLPSVLARSEHHLFFPDGILITQDETMPP